MSGALVVERLAVAHPVLGQPCHVHGSPIVARVVVGSLSRIACQSCVDNAVTGHNTEPGCERCGGVFHKARGCLCSCHAAAGEGVK